MNLPITVEGSVQMRPRAEKSPSGAETLVLILTGLGLIASVAEFVVFQEARAELTQSLAVGTLIPKSPAYYVTRAAQILLLMSAGVVAISSTNWRTIRSGYFLKFILLIGAVLLMTGRGYSLPDLLSTKLVNPTGPFPFLISVLVFVGARRQNWVYLSKAMIFLAILCSAMTLAGVASMSSFSRPEAIARISGPLNALYWPASWIALSDFPKHAVVMRLRFVPILIYGTASLFTETRLNFVMLACFMAVYMYVQRRRKAPQLVTWILGLTLAVWMILFAAVFLSDTRTFEVVQNVATAFSSRLDEDSRTGQLRWFFDSVRPGELWLGRGSLATWYWGAFGNYSGGTDVGYLTLLLFGGVPLLITYAITHLSPCFRILRAKTTDWRLVPAAIVVLWAIRMFSSSYPATSLEYYSILFCVGACISIQEVPVPLPYSL